MLSTLRRIITQLDLEEKILNAGALVSLIGVVCPWIGGEWLGGTSVLHTGFGFYTSFLGLAVFLLNGFILFVTLSPLMGGPPIISREQRNIARLLAAGQALVLTIAALSVLTRVAFEFSRVEIRFGIYTSMIGSLTASLYAFLKFQEERRNIAESFFYHDEPVAKEQDRRGRIDKIKEESIRLPSNDGLAPLTMTRDDKNPEPPSPLPNIVPNAPKVEEHPVFRGL